MNTQQIAEFRKVAAWVEDLRKDLNSNKIPAISQFRTLVGWRDLIKVATPDSDFEQSFFQLAYEKLQEKLYNLLPYLVGFEIVNKSDDGTKALGVFGFKSNNGQVIYVPAFFVNGTVKGIDIMYSKNNEQFYPLNEDFAELFLKDDSTGIGDASNESEKQINKGMCPVDMRDLVRPPHTGKTSYASLIDFVEDGSDLIKQAFYKLFTENDTFMESVLRFYPVEKVASAVAIKTKTKSVQKPSVQVVTPATMTAKTDNNIKAKAMTKGYAIIDNRADNEKSSFGLVKYPETFTNPTDCWFLFTISGFYSYLTEAGNIRYALIITKPLKLNTHFASDEAIVIDTKAGHSYRMQAKKVYVRNKYVVKDYSAAHGKMTEIAEAEPSFNETYILINEQLVATQPFRIRSNSKDDGIRKVEVETIRYGSAVGTSTSGRKLHGNFNTEPDKFTKATLILTKRPGDKLEYINDCIYVPKGFKLMNLDIDGPSMSDFMDLPVIGTDGWEEARSTRLSDYDADRKKWESGKPGSLAALKGALAERQIFPMTVKSNGSEYFVNIGQAKKKYPNAIKAKIALVTDVGLDEKQAEELIDSVLSMSKVEGYVKLAYTGDYTASLQDPSAYSNELGQPTYDGTGWSNQAPQDGQYSGDPTRIGMGTMPNVEGIDGAINQASQLAQSGQKQIFDTHSIATLAKYVSPESKTQSFMPDFISCLDKLGRMLFLVYWETDKFQEMFGRGELPELVELLTDVFKNLGDLVIFLKRKSPEISINMEKDQLGA